MDIKRNHRNIFQRILGIPATLKADPSAWHFEGGQVVVHLDRVPELGKPSGALRMEGQGVPERVLVMRGEDGKYHAYRNVCAHKGRRMDPVAGTETIQCCSVNEATYTYGCEKIHGPGDPKVTSYPVEEKDGKLYVRVT